MTDGVPIQTLTKAFKGRCRAEFLVTAGTNLADHDIGSGLIFVRIVSDELQMRQLDGRSPDEIPFSRGVGIEMLLSGSTDSLKAFAAALDGAAQMLRTELRFNSWCQCEHIIHQPPQQRP